MGESSSFTSCALLKKKYLGFINLLGKYFFLFKFQRWRRKWETLSIFQMIVPRAYWIQETKPNNRELTFSDRTFWYFFFYFFLIIFNFTNEDDGGCIHGWSKGVRFKPSDNAIGESGGVYGDMLCNWRPASLK